MKIVRIVFLSALLMGFTGVVQAQQWWGALYFSKTTGIVGGSYNMNSDGAARQTALDSCINKHKGQPNSCKYVISFYNGCAAIFWSAKDKHGGFGTSDYSQSQAETRAYQACVKQGGKNCQNQLSFCTNLIIY